MTAAAPQTAAPTIDRGLSLWLDILRVLATCIVILAHFAYPRFSGDALGWIITSNIASDAVILFFVVSGFVIAYAAERDAAPGRYAFNRLTRLWSVLIPAVVLTFVLDRFGAQADPAAYPSLFYNPLDLGTMLWRGLTFSNEFLLFDRIRLGSNGPLWSLSYEAAYYALFGAACFAAGLRRVVLIALLCVLTGINVLLLLPAWLCGVWAWRMVARGTAARLSTRDALILALGAPLLYAVAFLTGLPATLTALTAATLGVPPAIFAFSDEFVWNTLIALLAMGQIIGMARLWTSPTADLPLVRWLAGASFSLYVTHYPLLQFLNATLPDMPARPLWLLCGAVAGGLVFASVFERRVGALRQALRRAMTAFSPPKAKALDSTTST